MDLVKEILRDQPHDIVSYCAQYFKAIDEGKEEWRYKGKIGRFPIPPNKITHEEFLAMQEENYQGQFAPEYNQNQQMVDENGEAIDQDEAPEGEQDPEMLEETKQPDEEEEEQ